MDRAPKTRRQELVAVLIALAGGTLFFWELISIKLPGLSSTLLGDGGPIAIRLLGAGGLALVAVGSGVLFVTGYRVLRVLARVPDEAIRLDVQDNAVWSFVTAVAIVMCAVFFGIAL
jgi:hypothetical protein